MKNASPIYALMIDDSRSDISLMRRALKKSKNSCFLMTAPDGSEALRLLSACEVLPQLIILDLNMAGMTGLETLEALKSDVRYTHIPVVVFSSSTFEEDVIKSYRGHCSAFVRKPSDMSKLIPLVERMCAFWFSVVEYVKPS